MIMGNGAEQSLGELSSNRQRVADPMLERPRVGEARITQDFVETKALSRSLRWSTWELGMQWVNEHCSSMQLKQRWSMIGFWWSSLFTNIIPNGSIVIQTLSAFLFQGRTSCVKQTNTICNRWIFCGALVVVLILPALETRESWPDHHLHRWPPHFLPTEIKFKFLSELTFSWSALPWSWFKF